MARTLDITATEVNFEKQINGYNREQVDSYIEMLSNAYRGAYKEYVTISERYENLLGEYGALKKQAPQSATLDTALVGKVLADAEIMANKIVEAARAEALLIKAKAGDEAKELLCDARFRQAEAKRRILAADDYVAEAIAKLQALSK